MRVERRLGVQVVVAVVGDPLDRAALHRDHPAEAGEVLEPLLALEGAVRELAVVRVRDAHARGAVEQEVEAHPLPAEEEERREDANAVVEREEDQACT